MRRFLVVIGMILLMPFVVLLAVGFKYGAFQTIHLEERNMGPYLLIYQSFEGSYELSSEHLAFIYEDVIKNFGITPSKGFGIYYDKPTMTNQEKLHSDLGLILETQDEKQLDKLQKTYKIRQMAAQPSLVATFPYIGDGSPILGTLKVYPKLEEYIQKNGLARKSIMEIYDLPEGIIYYILAK